MRAFNSNPQRSNPVETGMDFFTSMLYHGNVADLIFICLSGYKQSLLSI